jgi:hypothetical protein
MSNTSDLLIWESRWLALDNLMASIANQSTSGDFPRKQTLISLAQRLRNFARGHYNFFADHLGNPADTLLTTSPDYPPEAIFTAIFKQIGNDLQAISAAITQRTPGVGNESMVETLQRADQLAHAALKPVLNTWLKRPANSEPQTVLTYFHRSAAVSVIPYAPVALVAIPYTCMVAPQDFLAIPHEIGHYVFWHGQQASEGSLRQLMRAQAIQLRPAWIARWVEEIFADVYGALLAGESIAHTSQDVQSAYAGVKFVQDDGRFPVPAIRPYIYTKTLELLGQFDQAEALEHRWYVRRSGRHVKLSTTAQLEYVQAASVPTMGEARSEMAKIVDDIYQLLGKLPSDWPQALTTTPADQLPALFKRLAPPPELNPRADISNLYDHWRESDPITDGPAPDEQGPIPIERWLRLVYANGWTMLS